MPSLGFKTRAELDDLIKTQLNAMERETFGVATKAELREYEDRRERIRQLYAELQNQPRSSRIACSGGPEEIKK